MAELNAAIYNLFIPNNDRNKKVYSIHNSKFLRKENMCH